MGKLTDLIKDPVYYYLYYLSMNKKDYLFNKYSRLSKKKGLDKLYFILSFDSDTEKDIEVVLDIHNRLTKLGMKPVYAVPGELLIKGREVYSKIAATGSEFINHGYKQHTLYNEKKGVYDSIFFYDQLSEDEIREDILKGDKTLKEVLNINPKGFRIPHFGTCQNKKLMCFIHSILKEMGYKYSTSTLPYHGFRNGCIFNKYGLIEFPVSGKWSRPFEILDSWSSFYNKNSNSKEYIEEGTNIANFFENNKIAGILNYYTDPSQVHNKEQFFTTAEHWNKVGKSISYNDLLEELQG